MLSVRYEISPPTDEQTQKHLLLAENVMGWVVEKELIPTAPDDRNRIYVHSKDGCLVSSSLLVPLNGRKTVYVLSYQPWSPSTDPSACAELRKQLCKNGFKIDIIEDSNHIQCCIIVGCDFYIANGASPEEAVVNAAHSIFG